jgi:uncharacterized sulfatase
MTRIALGLLLLAAPVQAEKVNVVVILADDLGWGDLGCYGHPAFKTPNLDRMAREGARLTHFTVPVPYCAPTRGSLLTGRYPMRHGLVRNPFPREDLGGVRGDAGDVGLAESEVTLAEALQGAGYRTGMVGKWHLGHQPRFYPTRQGFQEYFGILYSNDMHPVKLVDGEREVEYPVVQATLTRRYTERALRFLEENKDRPFFLYLAHAMPHKPLAVSEDFYKKSGAGLYGDAVAELDWSVGRVLDSIRALGLDGRTLVWFTSDNGPWYGGSAGGLRGMKGLSFEGGLRVPLIARWPGRIPAGRVSHEPAVVMDLFATSLQAAGVAPPAGRTIDGRDILPLLTSDAKSPHEAVFSSRAGQVVTVRSGRWKLHLLAPDGAREKAWAPDEKWTDPRAPDGVRLLAPFEQAHPSQYPGARGTPVTAPALFDLEDDPAEQKNVAEAHADVVGRLRALAQQFTSDLARERREK